MEVKLHTHRQYKTTSEDKIVVAGDTYNGSDYDFAVVRYKSNGFLDNTFGTNGRVITQIGSGSNDHARQVLIQNDQQNNSCRLFR